MKSIQTVRVASPLHMWGVTISAAIAGELSGRNAGLLEGGFGGMMNSVTDFKVSWKAKKF